MGNSSQEVKINTSAALVGVDHALSNPLHKVHTHLFVLEHFVNKIGRTGQHCSEDFTAHGTLIHHGNKRAKRQRRLKHTGGKHWPHLDGTVYEVTICFCIFLRKLGNGLAGFIKIGKSAHPGFIIKQGYIGPFWIVEGQTKL